MKQQRLKTPIKTLAAAILLTASAASYAGSITSNVTLAGSLRPKTVCSFGALPTISFNDSVTKGYSQTGPFNVTVTCTNGAPYSLTGAVVWHPVKIGTQDAGIALGNQYGYDLNDDPVYMTGNGSAQAIPLVATLGGTAEYSYFDQSKHFGVVSGTVQLVLNY